MADFPSSIYQRLEAALSRSGRPTIGICGLSGAGKTSLCEEILHRFPDQAVHLRGDSFSKYSYRERTQRIEAARASGNPAAIEAEEHPMHWTDWRGMWAVADALKSGQGGTYENGWNRATGELDLPIKYLRPKSENYLIIVDTIYLLHPAARERLDKVILVKPDEARRKEQSARRRQGPPTDWSKYIDRLEVLYSQPYFQKFETAAHWVIY